MVERPQTDIDALTAGLDKLTVCGNLLTAYKACAGHKEHMPPRLMELTVTLAAPAQPLPRPGLYQLQPQAEAYYTVPQNV